MRTVNGVGTTIYGRAKKINLVGTARQDALAAGFLPCSYQVVKWFVFWFLPVVPLGTYRVIKMRQRFLSFDGRYYKMQKVPWDWWQILRQYLIVYGPFIVLIAFAIVASS